MPDHASRAFRQLTGALGLTFGFVFARTNVTVASAGGGELMDDRTLLWHLYQDNRKQAQFHETQRHNGSGLIAGGAAVIVAAIADDGIYARSEVPLTVILLLLGIFGYLFCHKTSERMQLHLNRCRRFLPMLDSMDSELDLMAIKDECDEETAKQFPWAHKVKLRRFWEWMHGLVALAGLAILGRIYLS
jgi:hypothetical protein